MPRGRNLCACKMGTLGLHVPRAKARCKVGPPFDWAMPASGTQSVVVSNRAPLDWEELPQVLQAPPTFLVQDLDVPAGQPLSAAASKIARKMPLPKYNALLRSVAQGLGAPPQEAAKLSSYSLTVLLTAASVLQFAPHEKQALGNWTELPASASAPASKPGMVVGMPQHYAGDQAVASAAFIKAQVLPLRTRPASSRLSRPVVRGMTFACMHSREKQSCSTSCSNLSPLAKWQSYRMHMLAPLPVLPPQVHMSLWMQPRRWTQLSQGLSSQRKARSIWSKRAEVLDQPYLATVIRRLSQRTRHPQENTPLVVAEFAGCTFSRSCGRKTAYRSLAPDASQSTLIGSTDVHSKAGLPRVPPSHQATCIRIACPLLTELHLRNDSRNAMAWLSSCFTHDRVVSLRQRHLAMLGSCRCHGTA